MMKAKDFKALSLNAQNTNTLNMALALELLGVKYQPVPAYRGLKDVETGILQNLGTDGELLAVGLARLGRADDGKQGIVMPLWQVAPPRQGRHLSAQRCRPRDTDLRRVLRNDLPRQETVGHRV